MLIIMIFLYSNLVYSDTLRVPIADRGRIENSLGKNIAHRFANIVLKRIPERGGLVSLDGPSGIGKGPLLERQKEVIEERGVRKGRVVMIDIDELLRDRNWRQAIERTIAGFDLSKEQKTSLADYDIGKISPEEFF